MAGQLLLVNPRKRRKNPHRRRKSSETHAERVRAAKKGWAHRRRKRNPESRRERSLAARRGWAHRRHHTVHHRRRRRNPAARKMGFFSPIMPAVIAAAGALGLDLIWGYAPVPATWKTGTMGYAAKGFGALALGAVLGMVMKKDTAEALAAGALTVTIHGALKDTIQSSMPNIQLGEIYPGLGYMSPGIVVNDEPQALTHAGYSDAGMGEISMDTGVYSMQ